MAGGVEFHTGVPDMAAFACRLLRKAYRRGATVLCLAPAQRLESLDRALWTFVEREFVPHAVVGRVAARVLERSPIWLATAPPGVDEPGGGRRDVVVNLGGALPVETALTMRVIEVVGAEDDEVERGRALWRQYRAQGLEVVHHPFRSAHAD